ncbi:hypothetical protein L861_05415 [Litchfieldella anticariensis FP35 = DSM 16096]|uniref:Uncharacterized protein n=1 Tax=Litchfieldella anticariensis (strain DSM 16096 / CECT 5854 / CIP 108499 / LMG 22089 / FP35) TaxID=1121939 RepID=S2L1F4_LITA3|nr:hypothetical protein [Halomonas anticariensis]EPC01479.1 hypothetical protein L861_05415 [Halomonas anticariensis FP35 = DSM 16096]
MIKKLFAALALMLFMSPAWAHMCPSLMGEIDEALADEAVVAELDEGQLEKVRELRQQGEQYHNDGEHDQSVETLNDAKGILGI